MKGLLGVSMVLVSCLLAPLAAQAAGFAKQSMFLSQQTVVEGQTVFIYAVVTDDSDQAFAGELQFTDEKGPIGSAKVTLDAGKASTVSVSWTPTAGQHAVTATLVSNTGSTTEKEDAIFFVDATQASTTTSLPVEDLSKPVEHTERIQGVGTTTVNSSEPIVRTIARFSPQAAIKTLPVFNTTDQFRTSFVKNLDGGTEWSKESMARAATAQGGIVNTLWLIASTLVLYVCASLAYVVATIGIFYPAIVAIFFFVIWRIYRTIKDY